MNRLLRNAVFATCMITTLCAVAESTTETAEIARSLSAKADQITAFSADVHVTDLRDGAETTSTFMLTLSREHGWKMEGTGAGGKFVVIDNFEQDVRWLPERKTAWVLRADRPELKALFRKPVTDLNALALMDASTLVYKGKDEMDGVTVHRFAGSTTTQYLAEGDPVTRRMEIWIGEPDGLPRKTVEHIEGSAGITIYTHVSPGIAAKATDFVFTATSETKVIDTNAELKALQAAAASTESTTAPAARKP